MDGLRRTTIPFASIDHRASANCRYLIATSESHRWMHFATSTIWTTTNRALVKAFILNCMRPVGLPYMCLFIEGDQGSGKSVLCSSIRRIVDPNRTERLRLARSDRDLMIHAKESFLLVYDNVSGIKNDISDALCTLSTGGGLGTRKLYTDEELHTFDSLRPFILNGIGDFAKRQDLVDRAIPISLDAIPKGKRRTQGQMATEIEALLRGILAELFDMIAAGLRNLPNVAAPTDFRMADAAHWLVAVEHESGVEGSPLLEAVTNRQEELVIDQAHNESLFIQLNEVIRDGPFEGTVGQLFDRLSPDDSDRYFPRNAVGLSAALKRLKPAMEKAGLFVEFRRRTREGRIVRVWKEGQEDMAPQPDPSRPLFGGAY